MQNIAVIFGGRTVEHDISVITGMGIIKNISAKYNVIPIYISKGGVWLTGEHLKNAKVYNTEPNGKLCSIPLDEPYLVYKVGLKKVKTKIDCAVLALHGGDYEGGAVQGVLELAGVPYTSTDVLGSALCMDKVLTKLALKGLGVHSARFVWGVETQDLCTKTSKAKLHYPLIVKPARAGSSIGITKVADKQDLKKAIEYAFNFDTKVLVEECFAEFRELSISAFRLHDEVKCSAIEEDFTHSTVFDFNEKYCTQDTKRVVPADLEKSISEEIERMSRQVYSEFDLNGVVRIDYLLVGETIYLNEINTIPGSLAFYLWRSKGISFGKLIALSIEQAIRVHEKKQNITYEYTSNVLNSLGSIDKIIEK